jgi:thiamine-phosphate pyrophosphorylase
VTGEAATRADWPGLVRAVVAAGVDWVQVRDRTLAAAALQDFVERILGAAREGAAERAGGARVLVNRRVDVALATGADGVHLGFDALGVGEARRAWRELGGAPAGLIGAATHSPEEVAEAAAAGADYALLAPIFDPLSKARERPALGTAALARASQLLGDRRGFVLLAQGGIDAERAAEALRAGAGGVAVTGAVLGATHPAEAAASLRATLDRAAR